MGWVYILIAGILEVAFAVLLKLSEGFTRLPYTLGFIVCTGVSLWFLTLAMRTIPFGTSYAVWTGIGVLGTTVIGVLHFQDPVTGLRLFFTLTLLGSIVGLKLTS